MYVGKITSQCEKHFSRFIKLYLKRPSGHFDRCVIFLHYIMCEALLAMYNHTSLHTITNACGYKIPPWLQTRTLFHSSTEHVQIRNMFRHTCSNVIYDVLPFIVPSLLSLSSCFQCCLVEPFTGKGQNVTTDNFFTTVKLAEKPKAQNKSIVGTQNRIRREISQSVKQSRKDRYSTTMLKITCLYSQFTNASLQKMSLC